MLASSLRMRAPVASRSASRTSSFMACPVVAPIRTVAAPARTTTVLVEAGSKQAGGKLKTKKAAAKRFKITGTGKLMARQAGKQHFNEKKTRSDILAMSSTFVIFSGDIYKAKKCLPNSGIGK